LPTREKVEFRATKLFIVEFNFKEKRIEELYLTEKGENVVLSVQQPAKQESLFSSVNDSEEADGVPDQLIQQQIQRKEHRAWNEEVNLRDSNVMLDP